MLKLTRTLRLLRVSLVLAVGVVMLAAGVAAAHYNRIDRHYGWGDVDAGHAHIHVCDIEADGYYVKVQYTATGGEVRQITDQDGSGGLCPYGHADIGSPANGQFRLCKVTVDCSVWYQY